MKNKIYKKRQFFLALIAILMFAVSIAAQTNEFTYQGQLQNASAPANGNFDFEFLLYDALSGGSQIGSTLTRNGVAVANGIFSVKLDFGSNYPGATRFLEIHVIQTGGGAFTPLTPRQAVSSAPYSVKSLTADNATNAVNFSGPLSGDVNGTQTSTTVARLQGRNLAGTAPIDGQVIKFNSATNQWEPNTDNTSSGGGGTITGVTPGTGLTGGGATGNVTLSIANGGVGTTQLADNNVTDAKINGVSGSKVTGTVANATNAVNATNLTGNLTGDVTGTQVATAVTRLQGRNFASTAPIDGQVIKFNTATSQWEPGTDNTSSGGGGTITGVAPGTGLTGGGATGNVTLGIANGGVGTTQLADNNVTDAKINSVSGSKITGEIPVAGVPTGNNNYIQNTTSLNLSRPNSVQQAANFNIGGDGIIGSNLGIGVTAAESGYRLDVNGIGVFRTGNGRINLASPNGETGMAIISNSNNRADVRFDGTFLKLLVGIGTGAPSNGMVIDTQGGLRIGTTSTGNGAKLYVDGGSDVAIRAETTDGFGVSGTSTNGRGVYGQTTNGYAGYFQGKVRVANIPYAASVARVCFNAQGDLLNCDASSLRLKKNVSPFFGGLNLIKQFNPISFDWKDGSGHDIGLAAEDVAKIDPFFAFTDKAGEVQGVKYERLNILLINAVKEQQTQIQMQQRQIDQLKKIVCRRHTRNGICKERTK